MADRDLERLKREAGVALTEAEKKNAAKQMRQMRQRSKKPPMTLDRLRELSKKAGGRG